VVLKIWGSRITAQFFNRDAWTNFELIAVVLLAASKFVFGDAMQQHVWFAIIGGSICILYILLRIRGNPALLRSWGFSGENLRASLRIVLPVTLTATAGAVIYGVLSGTALWKWNIPLLLLLYPAWGVVQQYLLVVLTAGNLDRITRGRWPRFFIILPTAVLFSLVHIPVPILMIATFFMGGFTTTLFLRHRDIWGPGLFHGIFATALYYFVLGQDPLQGFLPLW
jgi:hypothetical protein